MRQKTKYLGPYFISLFIKIYSDYKPNNIIPIKFFVHLLVLGVK